MYMLGQLLQPCTASRGRYGFIRTRSSMNGCTQFLLYSIILRAYSCLNIGGPNYSSQYGTLRYRKLS